LTAILANPIHIRISLLSSALKRLLPAAFAACLFLLIVGGKWATFDRYGSAMPDWDQWDAEAVELLIPWFENDDFLRHLLHPHNEHRVIMTKLQNLALVLLNGQWDSRLEAATNALVHAALAVGFWLFGRRCLAARWQPMLFLLLLALFALPVAWQNVLGGFHSQQYWLAGLSFAAIALVPFARTGSLGWWTGIVAAVLALGTMGSGFLAAAVVLVVLGWRLLRGNATLRETWPALALMSALVAFGLLTRVEVEWHSNLKAKSVHDFVFTIVHSLQWPWRGKHWAAIVLWLPWLLVVYHAVRWPATTSRRDNVTPTAGQDAPSGHPAWGSVAPPLAHALTIGALGLWVLVQLAATGYARGAGADYPASRYMDTLTFGAAVNALALGWLLSRGGVPPGLRLSRYAVSLAWILTFGFGLHNLLAHTVRWELADAKKYYLKAESNMRRYLASNDPKQLAHPEIPFPSAEGLIERLARPSLRSLMPLPIRAPLPLTAAAGNAATFLENDARFDDSETPPRRGLSPTTAPLDALVSWGSFGAEGLAGQGVWKSQPLTSPFPWLKFETAGDVGPPFNQPVSLALHDAETGALLAEVTPSRRPRDSWRAAYVRTPTRPFVVVATDKSRGGWVAFTAPVEMGGASYWAWQATKHGLLIVYAAVAATLGLFGFALWRR
jgi:hypothetical protein